MTRFDTGWSAPDPASSQVFLDGVDVDAVAAAARACAGVSDLFAGRFGEVGTYLPGRRVAGVVVEENSLTVQVRSRWGVPAPALLRQLAAALDGVRHGHELHVVVADIDDPPEDDVLELTASTPAPALEAGSRAIPIPATSADPHPALPGLDAPSVRPIESEF